MTELLPTPTKRRLIGMAGTIHEVLTEGFQDYFSLYGAHAACHASRTRACLIHDHQRDRAKSAFALLQESWQYHELHTRGMFIFDDFILCFKRLDQDLLPSNVPTQTSLGFDEQIALPGIPPTLPRIIAGYVPNVDWSGITSTHLVFRLGRVMLWHVCLEEELMEALDTVTARTNPIPDAAQKRKPLRVKDEILPDRKIRKDSNA